MHDPRRLNLPKRRLFGVVLARFAGGIDAVLHDRVFAADAIGASCGEAGIGGCLQSQGIDKAVAVILRQIDELAVSELAVGLGDPGVAARLQPFAFLIVDDLVGLNGRAIEIDLDVADGGDRVVGVIVFNFVSLHEHWRVGRLRRRRRLRRSLRKAQQTADALRRRWRCRQQIAGEARQQHRRDCEAQRGTGPTTKQYADGRSRH